MKSNPERLEEMRKRERARFTSKLVTGRLERWEMGQDASRRIPGFEAQVEEWGGACMEEFLVVDVMNTAAVASIQSRLQMICELSALIKPGKGDE